MHTLNHTFDWLLAASLRASLLTIAVLLIQTALRHHLSARMRHALWLPMLVVLLMPVLPQSRWSIEHVFQSPPAPVQITPAVIATSVEPMPVVLESLPAMPTPIDWQRILLTAWISGAISILIIGSISFMLTLRRFNQARHPASDELLATLAQIAAEVRLRHVPRVLIATTVSSPAVTGLLRPTLLLPAQFDRDFTPAEAHLVLKHELMHLKRGDLPLNALMCVLMALHWFNPLLWLAFFKIRADREAACDAQVLHDAPNDRRIAYGHALLKVETAFCPCGFNLGFVGIFQHGSALRSRIQSIVTHRRSHPATNIITGLCIALMTFFGITRAQQPAASKENAPLIAIEIKIMEFKSATDWDFGGKLKAVTKDGFAASQLTADALQSMLRDLHKQPELNTTAYPRMVTRAGKEVTIRSVVNNPYKGKDGKVAYLPIGFVCKLKAALSGEQINLDIDITDSNLIDPASGAVVSAVKDEEENPTTRSSVFHGEFDFQPGQSSVIYGWDEGSPQHKRPLIYVITPKVVDPMQGGLPVNGLDLTTAAETPAAYLKTKLDKIIIPRIQFQSATVEESIEYLRLQSRALDTLTADPAQRGVNILLRPGDIPAKTAISLDLKDVPLGEALRYVTELANLKMSLQPYAVLIGKNIPVAATGSPTASPAQKSATAVHGDKIILPSLEFRDASLSECIEYIRVKSRDLDPDKQGINILVKPGGDETTRITLSLKNVPVSEALRYCAELANHKLSADEQAFVLTPNNAK